MSDVPKVEVSKAIRRHSEVVLLIDDDPAQCNAPRQSKIVTGLGIFTGSL